MPIFSPGLCGCLILLVGWVFDSRRLRQISDIIGKTVISNIDGPSLSTSVIHKIAKRGMKMGFSVSTATNPSYMYQTPSGYIFRLRIPKELRALMATWKYPTCGHLKIPHLAGGHFKIPHPVDGRGQNFSDRTFLSDYSFSFPIASLLAASVNL